MVFAVPDDIISEMRAEVRDLRYEIARLDDRLRPYYNARKHLVSEIIETFPHTTIEDENGYTRVCVTAYSRSGAGMRHDVQIELDRLNVAHWPFTEKRKRLKSICGGLEKAIARMEERQRKKPQRQMEYARGDL